MSGREGARRGSGFWSKQRVGGPSSMGTRKGEGRYREGKMRDLFYISCPIVALSKCFSSIFLVDMALLWVKMESQ